MAKRETAYVMESGTSLQMLSSSYLKTVFEYSFDGIYITDGNAVTIAVNKSYETISGLARHEMLGCSMWDLVTRKVISRSGTIEALRKKEAVTMEQIFRTGKHAVITSTPIFDSENNIVLVVTNVRDVTELHGLQEQLQNSLNRNVLYQSEIENLRGQVRRSDGIVAIDPAMKEVLKTAGRVAALDIPVLLKGEIGTGKQALARYIVGKSKRKKEKFVEINCQSYSEEALEKEIFGSMRTSSQGNEPGLLTIADGGTILFYEVSELPLDLQGKLAYYIQNSIKRHGSEGVPNVRILACTNVNLEKLVEEHLFREDLYYALNVLPINVLPLRHRKEDIPHLVVEIATQLNKKYHSKKRFSRDALMELKKYGWPGNIRELSNFVESAMILCEADVIGTEDLPFPASYGAVGKEHRVKQGPVVLREVVEEIEFEYITKAYDQYGNVRDAARSLGMDPSTFVRKRARLTEEFENR